MDVHVDKNHRRQELCRCDMCSIFIRFFFRLEVNQPVKARRCWKTVK
jgi:hypothetical protein